MRNILGITLAFVFASACAAADNELTERERQDGWLLLFDGQTLNGWVTNDREPSKRPVEDHCLNPHLCGGYFLMHEREWSDYILSLDFKISKGCNSGIFIRTYPLLLPPDWSVGMRGIEVAIDDTTTAEFYDTGAFYDLVKPKRNAMKPIGEWNHIVITCDRNIMSVRLNDQDVTRMDLDEWTQHGKRPDGSPHKFTNREYKLHPRHGYIGLQDHGGECWYKNIKIKPLNGTATQPAATPAAK